MSSLVNKTTIVVRLPWKATVNNVMPWVSGQQAQLPKNLGSRVRLQPDKAAVLWTNDADRAVIKIQCNSNRP